LQGGQDEAAADDALPQIVPAAPHQQREPFPLSDLQVGFYMGSDEFMEYHVRPHYYFEFDYAELDVQRYQRAWQKALERHAGSLAIVTPDIQLQAIGDLPPLVFGVTDLRGRPVQEARASIEALRARMSREELPIDRWPWFDWHITLYADTRVRVHFNANNFFSDGYGTSKLLTQVQQFYDDPQLQLPALELTFRDCVLALQQVENSPLGRKSKDYWMRRLPEMPRPPALPQVPNMNTRCRSRMVRRSKVLEPAVWRAFKATAAKHGLTPTSAVYAVYVEILALWGNSRHFVINNMVTHRFPMHPQIKEIIGNFASLYPLEVDLRGDNTLAERAQRLQQRVFEDLENVYCSGMHVLQELNRLQGEPGRAPCPHVVGSGLFMESWEVHEYSCLETSQTQLDHQFWELEDESYYFVWDLLEEFFPSGVIDAMWSAYVGLIGRLAEDPRLWLEKTLPLVPPEHIESYQAANATEGAVHQGLAHEFLAHAAARQPRHPAVVTPAVTLTYDDLYRRANRIARRLRQLGARPNQLIAIVMEKGWEQVAGAFGILTSGAAYVPVDPSLPPERLHYLLANAEVSIVLTQKHVDVACVWPDSVQRLCVDDTVFDSLDDAPLVSVQGRNDMAYIIYTSGSTGAPKGVMVDHAGVVNTLVDINRRFDIGPEDRVFGISSLSFDLSVYDVFGTVAAGATLVLPDHQALRDPVHWRQLIRQDHVTVWNSVPALMQLLVDSVPEGATELASLRIVLMSGDWIPTTLPARVRQAAPSARVISLGGATEASIWSICYPIDAVDTAWTSIPYGRPLANQRFYVLNESLDPCPIWVAGQLYIGGIGLAQGYWRDPVKTAASFITHPRTGERLYRTGDLGRYRPDGNIEFLGREDFQVKVNGYRIELGEIEASLREYAATKDVIVVAQDGDSGKRLVAYVVLDAAHARDAEPIRAHLKERLPDYMLPAAFVFLDALPLTPNGKVDRKALPVEKVTPREGPREFVAPRDETESELVRIWESVLKVPRPFGVRDEFFGLGGHSFAAVQVISRIRTQFGKSLSLSVLLEGCTVENLAERLRRADGPAWSPLVAIEKGEGMPCFFVHPAGGSVLCYRELAGLLGSPFYGFQAAGLDGQAPPQADAVAMADQYVRELQRVQPHGPYLIGGWSSGGVIALEMVRKLEAAGAQVARLVVLDCPAPLQPHAPDLPAHLLRWFLEDLNVGVPMELLDVDVLQDVPAHELLPFALARLKAHGWSSDVTDLDDLDTIFQVFKATVVATRSYKAEPIEADIQLFRARDGVVGEFRDHPYGSRDDWGWRLLTSGSVYCKTVEGSHYTILSQPGLAQVASALVEWTGDATEKDEAAIDAIS
jgi:amino acid adenylation domain-containing protein